MKYIVIVKVKGIEYLTNTEAISASAAEHSFLDKGICGKHTSSVEACMAYDAEMMKTDAFIGMAISSKAIGAIALQDLIYKRNEEIKAKDEAEDTVRELEGQMKELSEKLEAAKKVLAA